MTQARGTFEVTLTPQQTDGDGWGPGRLVIEKTYAGDLQGTASGQMLTAMGGVAGSAAYVAIERVTGSLAGRRGSFVLQHSGTMTRGEARLVVAVVPDSGTDQLEGLAGGMTIEASGGGHTYQLDYRLPASG